MVYECGILAPGFGFVLSVASCLLVLHSIWHLFSGVWLFCLGSRVWLLVSSSLLTLPALLYLSGFYHSTHK
jgi:hypothetical protein